MLVVPAELLDAAVSHARRGAPEEVCGWLAGKEGRALRLYPVANAARNPLRRFRMDPQGQIDAMREIRERGLDLAATYHSHPRTPPEPSARDAELAAYPGSLHLIISLATGEPEVRCYRIAEGGCHPVPLAVERARSA